MSKGLIAELGKYQQQLLVTIEEIPEPDCYQQFHHDLSPLAWHLGHCAFIETYWIYNKVLGQPGRTREDQNLYFPELSPKTERTTKMAGKSELMAQVADEFAANSEALDQLYASNNDNPLMADDYLVHFLIQHHCQHLETIDQILQQRALQQHWKDRHLSKPEEVNPSGEIVYIEPGNYAVGNPNASIAFDNERPTWSTDLARYGLSRRPASNSEYLGFMLHGGYQNRSWWSDAGWNWLMDSGAKSPEHWRQARDGSWYALNCDGPEPLRSSDSIFGINWYEAEAYCRYAGGRLPHELEYEVAATNGVIESGGAWEWCSNNFFPYPGYQAYPYERYSKPWFDQHHFSLRGSSQFTRPPIQRPAFRNFYTPEKRHVFAGVRVAYDYQ